MIKQQQQKLNLVQDPNWWLATRAFQQAVEDAHLGSPHVDVQPVFPSHKSDLQYHFELFCKLKLTPLLFNMPNLS